MNDVQDAIHILYIHVLENTYKEDIRVGVNYLVCARSFCEVQINGSGELLLSKNNSPLEVMAMYSGDIGQYVIQFDNGDRIRFETTGNLETKFTLTRPPPRIDQSQEQIKGLQERIDQLTESHNKLDYQVTKLLIHLAGI